MNMRVLWLVVGAIVSLGSAVFAGDDCCCQRCGCHDNLNKTCRLVCETKEVKEPKYSIKCEDFCVPGPSQRCGKECECDCNSWFGHTCKWVWEPTTCAAVHTRKILVKEEVKKKVPSYKWVVEYKCGGCGHCGSVEKTVEGKSAAAEIEAPLPAELPVAARLTDSVR